MAKLFLYSTSPGQGFDMRSDWWSKTGNPINGGSATYRVETANSFRFGADSSNYIAVNVSTAPWDPEFLEYDYSNVTYFTLKAVDAGKTLFAFSDLNLNETQIGSQINSYLQSIGATSLTSKQYSNAVIYAGLQKSDTITGTAYGDYILSHAGMDTVNAGGGTDTVFGGASVDKLNGGASNDKLYGEAGDDILTGGSGLDKFVFSVALNPATNVDQITDFKVIDDEIWLDNDVFTKAGAIGQLVADAFHKGSSAADAQDRLIYNSSTGKLYYDRDGTGSSYAKVLIAELDTGLALTYKDFEVIG